MSHRGIESYRRTDIETRTPLELVVMLYDGAIRFANEARDAVVRRDIPARTAAVSRALAIVGELQGSLDLERGGSVAASLEELYAFISRRLMEASVRQDAAPFDEAIRVLTTLRDGWATVATAPRSEAVGA